jgi:hypothetical protein
VPLLWPFDARGPIRVTATSVPCPSGKTFLFQLRDPAYRLGANRVSLNEARESLERIPRLQRSHEIDGEESASLQGSCRITVALNGAAKISRRGS